MNPALDPIPTASSSPPSRISVIVPTCNRPAMLERCLTMIEGAYEVIITDDSSDPATRRLIEERFPQMRWIAGPRRGPAANRNHGAAAANGDWLAFIDDDCEPQPGWLAGMKPHPGMDVIEGKTVCPSDRDTPFEERVENLAGDSFWSCNLAFRREVFVQLGGFDEDFLDAAGEDMELAWRIRTRGLRTTFASEAVVVHPARRISWRKLLWRTWLLRWRLLYRLKTGGSPPLDATITRVVMTLARCECMELLRLTVHLFTRRDRQHPRTQLFHTARRWVTFPVVLPYLMAWEFRFRKALAKHSVSTESAR